MKPVQEWLTCMVSALLRIATYEDHLFILNHLLRCPPGLADWTAAFIQVLPSTGAGSQGQVAVDHALTVLATMTSPIRGREEFLQHMNSQNDNRTNASKPWVVLNSEGEEENEDASRPWLLLAESDLILLLSQLQLNDVFRFALRVTPGGAGGGGDDAYDPAEMSEAAMLGLFALGTCVVAILSRGLESFQQTRYRQLNKRIGWMLCETVQYICDHWSNYRRARPADTMTMLPRLCTEFDSFFCKATSSLFSAKRFGAWQFIAEMSFVCVSADTMWRLLLMLHTCSGAHHQVELPAGNPQEIMWKLQDGDTVQQLIDNLQAMPQQEAIFLLTALSNMAASRDDGERQLIEVIVALIYEASFIDQVTRDFCSKSGRDLLSSIAERHPFTISFLLGRVNTSMLRVGMMSLYLFHEIPLSLWQPTVDDVQLVRDWLLKGELASAESQLARLLLTGMNWGVTDTGEELFLPLDLHREVAVMVTEAYIKVIPESKGGLLYYSIQQLYNVSALVRQTPPQEQQFYSWATDLVHRLRLHAAAQPPPPGGAATRLGDAAFLAEVPDLHKTPRLRAVAASARDGGAMAAYVALAATAHGHNMADFLSDGLGMLARLAACQQHVSAVHALRVVTPLFLDNPSYLSTAERFVSVVRSISAADQTYVKMARDLFAPEFPGKVLQLFSSMMLVGDR
ncbi:PREDICTED: ectopic P granules protein 5 homolog [Priapulus caudatus]|uniref:Ectopic P granules protein 5 homolog n=1 Tax=Priapulus caudatus TaxID=37621 RepID=A0ABM1F4X9_PRICU|nr:PREDICTED: ectopic P granules protein 5 homolog [Priapulus caudatus]